jgi:nucleotide-binding universal stress UspA family protein
MLGVSPGRAALAPSPGFPVMLNRSVVIVGVDDSTGSRAALRWAAELALVFSMPLKVVHAFDPSDLVGNSGSDSRQPDTTWRDGAMGWLTGVVESEIGALTGLTLELRVEQDRPAAAILAAADDAAMIVVGSSGRSAAGSTLEASVSSAVLREARCAVVVVPVGAGRAPPHPSLLAAPEDGSFDDWMAVLSAEGEAVQPADDQP